MGFFKIKLGAKLVITILLLVFPVVIISSYFAVSNLSAINQAAQKQSHIIVNLAESTSEESLQQAAEEYLKIIARELSCQISNYLADRRQDILTLAELDKTSANFLAFVDLRTALIHRRSDQASHPEKSFPHKKNVNSVETISIFRQVIYADDRGEVKIKIINNKIASSSENISQTEYFLAAKNLPAGELYQMIRKYKIWDCSFRYSSLIGQPIYQIASTCPDKKILALDAGSQKKFTDDYLRYAAPVYKKGKFAGVIVADVAFLPIMEIVNNLKVKQSGYVFLEQSVEGTEEFKRGQGITLVHPNHQFILRMDPTTLHVLGTPGLDNLRELSEKQHRGDSGVGRYIFRGVDKYTAYTGFKEGRVVWSVGVTSPVNEFLASVEATRAKIKQAGTVFQLNLTKATANSILRFSLLVFALLAIEIVLIIFFAHRIVSPITELIRYVLRVDRGRFDANLKIDRSDEIGQLAKALKQMTCDLKQAHKQIEIYSRRLKGKAEEKTNELKRVIAKERRDKKALEEQRLATLNILEDVHKSQVELKQANEALKRQKFILEALKNLSDELFGNLEVETAIRTINKYLSKILDFNAGIYLIVNSTQEGEIIYQAFLQKEVSEDFLLQAEKEITKVLQKRKNKTWTAVLNIIKNLKPQTVGCKLNNFNQDKVKTKLVFPLQMGETVLGVICLVASDKDAFHGEGELIDAMVVTFTLFVSRLQALISVQHSKTSSLIKGLNDGVIMFNPDRKVILMNPAAVKYTHLTKGNFDYNKFYQLFPEHNIDKMIEKALNHGRLEHIQEIQLTDNFFEIFITPVKDNKGDIVGGAIIMHDITYLKEIDRMKTEFVSVASHQLRTPLTAIKLFTEMLLRGDTGKLNRAQKEYLNNIFQSTDRMTRLVNDLLNVTRIESGRVRINPQPTKLDELIQNIIVEAKPLADMKKVKLTFMVTDKAPTIPLDQNLFRQVIHNLIVNAIRYTPAGKGRILVTFKKYNNREYLISVADNGIGIPNDKQKKIFQKFFRADNAVKMETEGTGLGLYVSKMIVELSGGKIWFESQEGKGTTFFVTIPTKGMPAKEGERGLIIS
jgi:signal transduction histidine kinase